MNLTSPLLRSFHFRVTSNAIISQHRLVFDRCSTGTHPRSFSPRNVSNAGIPRNNAIQRGRRDREFQDGWVVLARLEILAGIRSGTGEKNGLLLPGTGCEQMYLAADLKNCILYSITRLSVRAAAPYNSQRIHASN